MMPPSKRYELPVIGRAKHSLFLSVAFISHVVLGALWTLADIFKTFWTKLGFYRQGSKIENKSAHVLRSTMFLPEDNDPTELITVGNPNESNATLVLVPGNPGNPGFYVMFLNKLYSLSGKKLACIAVGHLGHSSVAPSRNDALHDLDTQNQHKAKVLHALQIKYPKASFLLAGHSVGAHCMLQAFRHELVDRSRILMCIGLQPTLMHIGASPSGHSMYPLLKYFRDPLGYLAGLLFHLPRSVLHTLVRQYMGPKPDDVIVEEVLNLFHRNVARNLFHMALHEMHEILEVDNPEELHDMGLNSDKFIIYFSENDPWLSNQHELDIAELFPHARIINCADGIQHGFVKVSSERMAEITYSWIKHHVEK
eukprot:m.94090 g.94090  ORF g.94090 m.94090 type:complete len:367 (-) comp13426_c0_seq1:1159-2259(-)